MSKRQKNLKKSCLSGHVVLVKACDLPNIFQMWFNLCDSNWSCPGKCAWKGFFFKKRRWKISKMQALWYAGIYLRKKKKTTPKKQTMILTQEPSFFILFLFFSYSWIYQHEWKSCPSISQSKGERNDKNNCSQIFPYKFSNSKSNTFQIKLIFIYYCFY